MGMLIVTEEKVPEQFLKPDGSFNFAPNKKIRESLNLFGNISWKISVVQRIGAIVGLLNLIGTLAVEGNIAIVINEKEAHIEGVIRAFGSNTYSAFREISSTIDLLLHNLSLDSRGKINFRVDFSQVLIFKK